MAQGCERPQCVACRWCSCGGVCRRIRAVACLSLHGVLARHPRHHLRRRRCRHAHGRGCAISPRWNRRARAATSEADAMHVLLVLRADQLEGCTENSEEARELAMSRGARSLRVQAVARWQGAWREGLTLQSTFPHELRSRGCQDNRKHDPESIARCQCEQVATSDGTDGRTNAHG